MNEIILTVDLALTVNHSQVLLIKRADPPFLDKLVLPGGHLESSDISAKAACCREAKEEINLDIDENELELLAVLDSPGRDPRRGRRISIAYTIDFSAHQSVASCRASSDARSIHFRNISSLKKEELGFDHWKVIEMLQKTK